MSGPHDKQTLYPNLKRGSGAPATSTDKPKKLNGGWANLNRGGPGRKPGVPNTATLDVKALARTIVEDPIGLAKIREQYRDGVLPPPILLMLWYFAFGKPKERIEVQGQVDVLRFVISNQPEPLTLEADASSTLSPDAAEAESERVKKPNETG